MKTIYKYQLCTQDEQMISVRKNYKFRHLGLQDGILCIWLEVDTDNPPANLHLIIVGTGHPLPSVVGDYLGSVQQGPYVWHVYRGALGA